MCPAAVSPLNPPPLEPSARSASSLADCIQVFDRALDPAWCQQMIASFHALQRFQRRNGRGVRSGLEDSAWTELDITPLSDAGFKARLLHCMRRHLALYNQQLRLSIPVPETQRISELVIKRYQPSGDEGFQPHFDACGPKANRYLVFLWYLNDVDQGGETEFVDLGLRIAPRAGRLLMFPPAWMFQHAGRAPLSGDKYILSTYYLF